MNTRLRPPFHQRHRHGTLLLLAVLALRVLVPAGFMLAPVDGHAEIVLCGPHAGHAHGGHAGHDGPGTRLGAVDPTCPFAQSAAPAVALELPALPAAAAPPDGAMRDATSRLFVKTGPSRQQSPRGPPPPT